MYSETLITRKGIASGFGLLALLWSLALLPGCIEPYKPKIISTTQRYLVLDGFINSRGITSIKMSRTYDIASASKPPTESKATAYIEQESGPRYALQETAPGTYTSQYLTLNPANRYRLHVTIQGGLEYASDYVPVKTTPPIEKVEWRAEDTGISITLNTRDITNSTQYYRWEYDETWEVVPPFYPEVEYVQRKMRPISVPYPTLCWSNSHSSAIQIGKTTALSQDIVTNYPLQSLPTNSDRLYKKYSILVQQHALTREEYDYWELLRKNTENIGTLFDPLPAQLTGNVRCLNSDAEVALGFIGVHSLEEKRIFISRADLPTKWRVPTGYESCIPADTVFNSELDLYLGPNMFIPITPIYGNDGRVIAYFYSSVDCIDCRRRGVAVKPTFWE